MDDEILLIRPSPTFPYWGGLADEDPLGDILTEHVSNEEAPQG